MAIVVVSYLMVTQMGALMLRASEALNDDITGRLEAPTTTAPEDKS